MHQQVELAHAQDLIEKDQVPYPVTDQVITHTESTRPQTEGASTSR